MPNLTSGTLKERLKSPGLESYFNHELENDFVSISSSINKGIRQNQSVLKLHRTQVLGEVSGSLNIKGFFTKIKKQKHNNKTP